MGFAASIADVKGCRGPRTVRIGTFTHHVLANVSGKNSNTAGEQEFAQQRHQKSSLADSHPRDGLELTALRERRSTQRITAVAKAYIYLLTVQHCSSESFVRLLSILIL